MRSGAIDGYFDVVVLSDEIEVNKPDRRLYVMIGDNVETDIAGAVNAGWPAIWYNPGGEAMPDTLADADISEVTALADICGPLL